MRNCVKVGSFRKVENRWLREKYGEFRATSLDSPPYSCSYYFTLSLKTRLPKP